MPQTDVKSAADIVAFWRQAGPEKWFEKDESFDRTVTETFRATHEAAAAGHLAEWEKTAEGTLALLLVLDQFPRNMFRNTRRAFATDPLAREIARRALDRGFDKDVEQSLRSFFYLPFMHSEEMADQEFCVSLYEALGDNYSMKFAVEHADIIRKFGRFPHRNPVLGRASTPDEVAFLEDGGFGG
jgi:uncharacterized protein (DUF924 family)